MAQENITIKFTPEGDKALTIAIKNLDIATKRLQGTTSIYEKELKRMGLTQAQSNKFLKQGTKNLRLQSGAFATLRSNLLLYSFAVGLANKAIVSFVEKSSKIEGLEAGFNSLIRTVGGNEKSFSKLQKAVDHTVNSTDLLKQANNAMMLGVVKSDDELSQLFDTAQRLGKALGVDTTDAVNSLVTGMGRQSKLMLDNLGIIVQSEVAYERYAKKLGISSSALTDHQKKQAFNEETLRIAKGMVDELGEENISTAEALKQMEVATHDLNIAVGKALAPAVRAAAKALVLLAENMDAKAVRKYGTAILATGVAYLAFSGAAMRAAKASLMFIKANKAFLATMLAVTAVVEVLDQKFDMFGTEELSDEMKKLKAEMDKMNDSTLNSVDAVEKFEVALIRYMGVARRQEKVDTDLLVVNQKLNKFRKEAAEGTEAYHTALGFVATNAEEAAEMLALLTERQILQREKIEGQAITIQMWADQIFGVASAYNKLSQAQLDADRKGALAAANNIRNEKRREKEIAKIEAKFEKKQDKLNKRKKQIAVAETLMNTSTAIMKTYAEYGPTPTGIALAILMGIQGALQVATIKAQKFEQGGLVGGRRHSQGGTMIEAERGEFVMSRSAVSAVGIETMNRINAGGGAGNVNISFAGNVMSDDFIESEAIPKIKEAIRRGADIGVS
tara:strand:- start:576 stop:2600 length:2025 start_codon:yes stop_codon:yes gene_type:complete